jgi:hypothetical protein
MRTGCGIHDLFADIEDGHALLLNPQTFPLFVAKGANARDVGDAEAWANGDIRIDVRLNHKVSRLKKMIKQKTGLALDAQKLVFNGEVLDDKKTLIEHSLSSDDRVTRARTHAHATTHACAGCARTQARARARAHKHTRGQRYVRSVLEGTAAWAGFPEPRPGAHASEAARRPKLCHRWGRVLRYNLSHEGSESPKRRAGRRDQPERNQVCLQ